MANISKLEEKNRYHNWYHGYTYIALPYWGVDAVCGQIDTICLEQKLRFKVSTWATSGTISTQYYGHNYDADKVERYLKYDTFIIPPVNYKDNSNITLYIKVEKNIQPELDQFWSDIEDTEVITLNRTEAPPGSQKGYVLRREISEDAVKDLQMDLMPGFRLTWYYNQQLEPDSVLLWNSRYGERGRRFYRLLLNVFKINLQKSLDSLI